MVASEIIFLRSEFSKSAVESADPRVVAGLGDTDQGIASSVGHLPAWPFGIKVTGTFLVNIY